MPRPDDPHPELSLSADWRIDEVCQRFEAAWKSERRPRLEAYLGQGDDPEQRALFRELLLVELHHRGRAGESPAKEDYLSRFPHAAELIDTLLGSGETSGGCAPDQRTGPPEGQPADPVVPVLPGYEIAEELGRGGMGVVYKARQVGLKRWVALKMIRGAGTPTSLARFQSEAEAVARLNHPHIVQIYEIGQCPAAAGSGAPYLALEFAPGGSLDRCLRQQRPTPHESAGLVEILARAVHAAHLCGIVHRDLKPANILLAAAVAGSSGNTVFGFPKVSDFGLARITSGEGEESRRNGPLGVIVGTPEATWLRTQGQRRQPIRWPSGRCVCGWEPSSTTA